MPEYILPKYTPTEREAFLQPDKKIYLSPYYLQAAVYDVLSNFMLANDPQKIGFVFEQKYSKDPAQSGIYLANAFKLDLNNVQQRPAVLVYRDDLQISAPTMNQMIGINPAESETTKLHIAQAQLGVACIAQEVGFVEELSTYVTIPLMEFEEQIRNDLCLRRFRLAAISKPQLYQESKDHYIVVLSLQAVYDMGTIIYRDDLKIKTFSVIHKFE